MGQYPAESTATIDGGVRTFRRWSGGTLKAGP